MRIECRQGESHIGIGIVDEFLMVEQCILCLFCDLLTDASR